MSQMALDETKGRAANVAVPTQVPGSTFFALMAGLWGSFVTLLAVSPDYALTSAAPPGRCSNTVADGLT